MGDESGKYPVGYGKPPTEHRFKKGQSGNPRGRPRRAKQPAIDTRPGMRPTDAYFQIEANRLVGIREGNEVIRMPAMQAMFRAMITSAIKGNRFVQRDLAEFAMARDLADYDEQRQAFDNGMEYKRRWNNATEQARLAGLPEPAPVPHPDDVIIDPVTCFVRIVGPRTPEEKGKLDEAIVMRTEAQTAVSHCARKYQRAREPETKTRWLKGWLFQQRLFDVINDTVPPRYRTKLEDRSWHPDASREGEAVEELRKEGILLKPA